MSALRKRDLDELYEVNWDEIHPELRHILVEKKGEEESVIDEIQQEFMEIIEKYRGKSNSLIEVLHQVQEVIGFIPRAVQKEIARGLGVAPGEVASVISFYTHFSEKPRGKYQIALCKGTACYVKGSVKIIDRIEEKYGIKSGESTDDGLFSLEVVRCLGACGLGPVMTVNGKAHGLLNSEKAINILEKYRKEEM